MDNGLPTQKRTINFLTISNEPIPIKNYNIIIISWQSTLQDENIHKIKFSNLAQIGQIHRIRYIENFAI